MVIKHTEADFDDLSWHDCHVWRIDVHEGDPGEGDWISGLSFGIDYIVEWLCGVRKELAFRVAPAIMEFHDVTDARIKIDWGQTGFQASIHEFSIDAIERELIERQKVHLKRSYYRWTLRLNAVGGSVSFGATGFTQTLLAEPVVTTGQRLTRLQREQLIQGAH